MLSFPASNWDKQFALTKNAFSQKTSFPRTASRITSRLYLSDYWTARDEEKLKTLGITHVISVIEREPALPAIIPLQNRLHLRLIDQPTVNILEHLDTTTAFIVSALEENESNKVLVHCLQGISRSATVVCAYLVATTHLNHEKAIAHVQSRRGIVSPNSGFREQLAKYTEMVAKHKPTKHRATPLLPGVLKFSSIVAQFRRLKEEERKSIVTGVPGLGSKS